jgi:translation initiation factor 3 subunit K
MVALVITIAIILPFLDGTLNLWIKKYGWKEVENNHVFIANQDDNIKTKNITEKIDFENVASIMAGCR